MTALSQFDSPRPAARGFPPPVLRHKDFALFFFSLLVSNTGAWMASTAQSLCQNVWKFPSGHRHDQAAFSSFCSPTCWSTPSLKSAPETTNAIRF